jgi:hypothetical protein
VAVGISEGMTESEKEKELTNMKLKTNVFADRVARVARLSLGAVSLATVAMALMPQTMRAQENPLVLDNFQTGAGKIAATSGTQSVTQPGAGIVGGGRYISIVYDPGASSQFGQPSTLQVRPSADPKVLPPALIWSNGFDATPLIEVEYAGPNNDTPLGLNLTNYDRFRFSFEGLSTGVVLVAGVWYGGSFQYDASLPCALTASSNSFTVDLPFSAFTPEQLVPITWSDLDQLTIEITEGTSPLNSPNLAITGFYALPATDPAGTITCGTPTT